MKKLFLIIYFLFYGYFFLYCQNYLIFRGIIKDQDSKEALAFASICIQNEYIGTMSNENGKFDFKFLEKFKKDTLNISYMSYEVLKKPISKLDFKEKKYHVFYLKKSDIQLLPITIIADKITAREIVNKAVKKIPDNYYKSEHLMESYFISEDLHYKNGGISEKMKTEAAVEIYNPKYKKIRKISRIGKIKVEENFKILGIKKETSINDYENSFFSIYGNAIRGVIINNIFRYDNPHNRSFLKKRKNKIFDFKIKSQFTYNENLIYKISFKLKKIQKGLFNSKTKIYGDIYIRQKDYAILGIEYFRYVNTNFEEIFSHQKIEYKDYKGKLFLSYISSDNKTKVLDTEEYVPDSTKQNIKLLINKIKLENFTKIEKNKKDFDTHLNFQNNLKYIPEFWENYNYILDTISFQKKEFDFKN